MLQDMEGRAFPLKKLITLCTACLLALTGCNGDATTTPSSELTEPPATATLTVETPVPATEVPDDTPLPTDTLSLEVQPTETLPLPTGTPFLWDGNPDSLTLNDFPTQLSSGTQVADAVSALGPDDAGLYLVCQLPDYDTWLYGFYAPGDTQGLILRVGTQWQALGINFLTPQSLMPAMAYGDYDGDGDQELAIVNFSGGGTNTNVWGLSVVDFSDGSWQLFQFSPADYAAIVDLSLSCTYDAATDVLTLQAGEASLSLNVTQLGYPGLGAEMDASLGDWVLFTTEGDTISASFGITLWAPGMDAAGVRAATLSANVVYTGSAFGLTGPSLALPEF